MAEWYTRTTQGGFITEDEIQSCAVSAAKLNAGSVTVDKLGSGAVTSIKASTNLVTRSVIGVTGTPTSSGTGLGSTDYVVWKSDVPVTITSVHLVPMANWFAATTGGSFEVWSCLAGRIGAFCVSSTNHAIGSTQNGMRGIPVALTLTGVTLIANEALRVNVLGTTCYAPPAHAIVVNYLTSG
jgi:hypothetical protein